MSLTIQELQLAPVMEMRARELELAFPGEITFTSGRRTVHEQAHAMAVNHLQDPKSYLMRQYVHAAELLMSLVSPVDLSVDEITERLYDVMMDRPYLVRSPHLDGNAVDLLPMEEVDGLPTLSGSLVMGWIKSCADTTDFRTREGPVLHRWHWACVPSEEV